MFVKLSELLKQVLSTYTADKGNIMIYVNHHVSFCIHLLKDYLND